MKKLITIGIILVLFLALSYYFLLRYLNTGYTKPSNEVWTSFIGRDTTVGILPDQYANYFAYTLGRTKKNIGFKVSGAFPSTRYFSFNVYSLGDNTTQGSLVDYQIIPDSGKPNPFTSNSDSIDVRRHFTVHIVPEEYASLDLPNILPFKDNVKLLSMIMRLYDYNIDDFGGVDFPLVEAFTIKSEDDTIELVPTRLPRALNLRTIVRNFSLPGMVERLALLYKTEQLAALDGPSSGETVAIPFHAIDTKGYIENNDNRYLLSAITKQEEEVYLFKFRSPTFTKTFRDINKSEVRYWSFNLGNSETYNFNALKDEDAIIDDNGYVHIVLSSRDKVVERRTAQLGYNFLEWNMPWKKGLILFRHMLANSEFEAQIDNVPPIHSSMTDFSDTEASKYIGSFAPTGKRMSRADFLANNY